MIENYARENPALAKILSVKGSIDILVSSIGLEQINSYKFPEYFSQVLSSFVKDHDLQVEAEEISSIVNGFEAQKTKAQLECIITFAKEMGLENSQHIKQIAFAIMDGYYKRSLIEDITVLSKDVRLNPNVSEGVKNELAILITRAFWNISSMGGKDVKPVQSAVNLVNTLSAVGIEITERSEKAMNYINPVTYAKDDNLAKTFRKHVDFRRRISASSFKQNPEVEPNLEANQLNIFWQEFSAYKRLVTKRNDLLQKIDKTSETDANRGLLVNQLITIQEELSAEMNKLLVLFTGKGLVIKLDTKIKDATLLKDLVKTMPNKLAYDDTTGIITIKSYITYEEQESILSSFGNADDKMRVKKLIKDYRDEIESIFKQINQTFAERFMSMILNKPNKSFFSTGVGFSIHKGFDIILKNMSDKQETDINPEDIHQIISLLLTNLNWPPKVYGSLEKISSNLSPQNIMKSISDLRILLNKNFSKVDNVGKKYSETLKKEISGFGILSKAELIQKINEIEKKVLSISTFNNKDCDTLKEVFFKLREDCTDINLKMTINNLKAIIFANGSVFKGNSIADSLVKSSMLNLYTNIFINKYFNNEYKNADDVKSEDFFRLRYFTDMAGLHYVNRIKTANAGIESYIKINGKDVSFNNFLSLKMSEIAGRIESEFLNNDGNINEVIERYNRGEIGKHQLYDVYYETMEETIKNGLQSYLETRFIGEMIVFFEIDGEVKNQLPSWMSAKAIDIFMDNYHHVSRKLSNRFVGLSGLLREEIEKTQMFMESLKTKDGKESELQEKISEKTSIIDESKNELKKVSKNLMEVSPSLIKLLETCIDAYILFSKAPRELEAKQRMSIMDWEELERKIIEMLKTGKPMEYVHPITKVKYYMPKSEELEKLLTASVMGKIQSLDKDSESSRKNLSDKVMSKIKGIPNTNVKKVENDIHYFLMAKKNIILAKDDLDRIIRFSTLKDGTKLTDFNESIVTGLVELFTDKDMSTRNTVNIYLNGSEKLKQYISEKENMYYDEIKGQLVIIGSMSQFEKKELENFCDTETQKVQVGILYLRSSNLNAKDIVTTYLSKFFKDLSKAELLNMYNSVLDSDIAMGKEDKDRLKNMKVIVYSAVTSKKPDQTNFGLQGGGIKQHVATILRDVFFPKYIQQRLNPFMDGSDFDNGNNSYNVLIPSNLANRMHSEITRFFDKPLESLQKYNASYNRANLRLFQLMFDEHKTPEQAVELILKSWTDENGLNLDEASLVGLKGGINNIRDIMLSIAREIKVSFEASKMIGKLSYLSLMYELFSTKQYSVTVTSDEKFSKDSIATIFNGTQFEHYLEELPTFELIPGETYAQAMHRIMLKSLSKTPYLAYTKVDISSLIKDGQKVFSVADPMSQKKMRIERYRKIALDLVQGIIKKGNGSDIDNLGERDSQLRSELDSIADRAIRNISDNSSNPSEQILKGPWYTYPAQFLFRTGKDKTIELISGRDIDKSRGPLSQKHWQNFVIPRRMTMEERVAYTSSLDGLFTETGQLPESLIWLGERVPFAEAFREFSNFYDRSFAKESNKIISSYRFFQVLSNKLRLMDGGAGFRVDETKLNNENILKFAGDIDIIRKHLKEILSEEEFSLLTLDEDLLSKVREMISTGKFKAKSIHADFMNRFRVVLEKELVKERGQIRGVIVKEVDDFFPDKSAVQKELIVDAIYQDYRDGNMLEKDGSFKRIDGQIMSDALLKAGFKESNIPDIINRIKLNLNSIKIKQDRFNKFQSFFSYEDYPGTMLDLMPLMYKTEKPDFVLNADVDNIVYPDLFNSTTYFEQDPDTGLIGKVWHVIMQGWQNLAEQEQQLNRYSNMDHIWNRLLMLLKGMKANLYAQGCYNPLYIENFLEGTTYSSEINAHYPASYKKSNFYKSVDYLKNMGTTKWLKDLKEKNPAAFYTALTLSPIAAGLYFNAPGFLGTSMFMILTGLLAKSDTSVGKVANSFFPMQWLTSIGIGVAYATPFVFGGGANSIAAVSAGIMAGIMVQGMLNSLVWFRGEKRESLTIDIPSSVKKEMLKLEEKFASKTEPEMPPALKDIVFSLRLWNHNRYRRPNQLMEKYEEQIVELNKMLTSILDEEENQNTIRNFMKKLSYFRSQIDQGLFEQGNVIDKLFEDDEISNAAIKNISEDLGVSEASVKEVLSWIGDIDGQKVNEIIKLKDVDKFDADQIKRVLITKLQDNVRTVIAHLDGLNLPKEDIISKDISDITDNPSEEMRKIIFKYQSDWMDNVKQMYCEGKTPEDIFKALILLTEEDVDKVLENKMVIEKVISKYQQDIAERLQQTIIDEYLPLIEKSAQQEFITQVRSLDSLYSPHNMETTVKIFKYLSEYNNVSFEKRLIALSKEIKSFARNNNLNITSVRSVFEDLKHLNSIISKIISSLPVQERKSSFGKLNLVIDHVVERMEPYKTYSSTEDSITWLDWFVQGYMVKEIAKVIGMSGSNSSRLVTKSQREERWYSSTAAFLIPLILRDIIEHRQMRSLSTAADSINTFSYGWMNAANQLLKVNLALVGLGLFMPFIFGSNSSMITVATVALANFWLTMSTDTKVRVLLGLDKHQVNLSRGDENDMGLNTLLSTLTESGVKPNLGKYKAKFFDFTVGALLGRLNAKDFAVTVEMPDSHEDYLFDTGFNELVFYSVVNNVLLTSAVYNIGKSLQMMSPVSTIGWSIIGFWIAYEAVKSYGTMQVSGGAPLQFRGASPRINDILKKIFFIPQNKSPLSEISEKSVKETVE